MWSTAEYDGVRGVPWSILECAEYVEHAEYVEYAECPGVRGVHRARGAL